MDSFFADLATAARALGKRPAFALTAIGTLALGIGATAAIFSVVNAVLLEPLPYREPARLVHIWQDMRNRDVRDFPWPPADFHDLRLQAKSFEEVAALTTGQQVFPAPDGSSDSERIRTGAATPNLFRTLGARMQQGRDFAEADGMPPATAQAPGAQPQPPPPPPTILSHEFWQRRFGGDPAVIGRAIRFGDVPFEIVGVLAPGFELLFPPGINVERAVDVWTPLRINFAEGSRINVFLRVIGRLQPGVSLADAQGDVDAIAADLRSRFAIKETAGVHLRLEPMHADLVADVRPTILALMGAVSFVLLIACANVANLLLVRAASRERELAVRSAVGGSRGRLIRGLLTESLLLGGCAAAAGLALAWLGVPVLLALRPENLPRLDRVAIDPTVVAFAIGSALLSVVVFGLVPALRASQPDLMDLLRRSGRASALASGGRLRSAVVVLEVALSFVLLVGSGLMMRSFVALHRASPGYNPDGVLTFFIPNPRLPEPEARQAFVRDLRARLQALPGVQAVSAATPLPLDGREGLTRWGTEEALADPTRFQQATLHVVVPGYFEAMQTRVLAGREFDDADNTANAGVVILDRVAAAKAFAGEQAVGRTILLRFRANEPERLRVIGVVDHQRHRSLAGDGREGVYVPDAYMGYAFANRWTVRAAGDPAALARAVRAAVSAINPRAGVIDVQPMSVYLDRARAQTTFALTLLAVFGGVALALAAVGLYSVLSAAVRQRTPEIGVRMAFGAQHTGVFGMVVAHGLRLSAAGLAAGIIGALAVTQMLRSMLVGVEPGDPATFVTITAGFLVVAAIACAVPALRAARLDPMAALREE